MANPTNSMLFVMENVNRKFQDTWKFTPLASHQTFFRNQHFAISFALFFSRETRRQSVLSICLYCEHSSISFICDSSRISETHGAQRSWLFRWNASFAALYFLPLCGLRGLSGVAVKLYQTFFLYTLYILDFPGLRHRDIFFWKLTFST